MLFKDFIKLNTEFAMNNYEYATRKLVNDNISRVYKLLGPFNFDI